MAGPYYPELLAPEILDELREQAMAEDDAVTAYLCGVALSGLRTRPINSAAVARAMLAEHLNAIHAATGEYPVATHLDD